MKMSDITYERIKAAYQKKGFVWRDDVYAMNVFGIRSNDKTPDAFNDFLGMAYMSELGKPELFIVQGTTDPGTYYLEKPMNADGCFVLMPGQYKESHTRGLHCGKVPAFVQCGTLKGWLDNDRDKIVDYDTGKTKEGKDFGVNIHPMGDTLKVIYNWSAGCQGAATKDINFMLFLYDKQVEWTKRKTIDYTLFVELDFAEAKTNSVETDIS